MHNASKVLLGGVRSSIKDVTNEPSVIEAGLPCFRKSDGDLSVAKADGGLIGVSLGKTLDNTSARTAVCRRGVEVPVILDDGETPTIGEQVAFNDTTGKAGSVDTGLTAVNATFASGVLTGVKEDGTEVNVALIDFEGGL